MNSFKDCCDNAGCPQGGSDNFGGFGSRPRRSFSFYRDQCQDVAPSGFKPGGSLRGSVYVSLNGDMVGKFTGKLDGLLACVGSLGNVFGNMGANFPFSVQFGDRA